MRAKQISLLAAALAVAAVVLFKLSRRDLASGSVAQVDSPVSPPAATVSVGTNNNTRSRSLNLSKVRRRAAEFSDDERTAFHATFEQKMKPAVVKWCQAYDGHVPFS